MSSSPGLGKTVSGYFRRIRSLLYRSIVGLPNMARGIPQASWPRGGVWVAIVLWCGMVQGCSLEQQENWICETVCGMEEEEEARF